MARREELWTVKVGKRIAKLKRTREQIAGLPLQEQIQRFQFGQQAPYQQLQGFLSSVYGTPMASSQYAPVQQPQVNRLGQAAGGAILGSQIGSLFPSIGGTTGAVLGGLGGLLF